MSTGMSTEAEIGEALEILEESGKEIILLHCSSAYPTMMEDVNLNAMATLKDRFHKQVGYSDHTPGIEVPIAAAALGACVIEKQRLCKEISGSRQGDQKGRSLYPS